MGIRERMYQITTADEADRFIDQNPTAAIFKAGTCHKTMQGWGHIERFLRDRENVPVGIIQVVEHRPASNRVAERTQVVHQSPQIILFRSGQPVFDLDNWDITPENLEMAQGLLPEPTAQPETPTATSNLDNYKRLLDLYLNRQLNDYQFQTIYLNTFRSDAVLRSQEEFELINSLFGNPDQHHIHPTAIMAHEAQNPSPIPLRERVTALRQQLDQL